MPRIEMGENPATGLGGLASMKAVKAKEIDEQTSAAILAGFDFEINGTVYRFSYQTHNQQNFSDTANNALAALLGETPFSVDWNGYATGGELVTITLDAPQFLRLYQQGACAHKDKHRAIAWARKTALLDENTNSYEKIQAI